MIKDTAVSCVTNTGPDPEPGSAPPNTHHCPRALVHASPCSGWLGKSRALLRISDVPSEPPPLLAGASAWRLESCARVGAGVARAGQQDPPCPVQASPSQAGNGSCPAPQEPPAHSLGDTRCVLQHTDKHRGGKIHHGSF